VERSARQAYAEAVRPRLYPYARAVVQLARARGLQVIGITGVTQPLAEALAEDLGMDRVFGTPLAMRDGCATGEAVWGSPAGWKEERLGPLMNDPASDLPESLGMGDSAADLPLLGRLGRPVVVNPSPEVAAQARERGWPVLTAQDGVAERVAQLLQGPAWNRPPQGDGALRPPPPPHRER
jgi:phosphoserine phosphatase